eukprot:1124087-Rhodomonas_salina.2
MMDVRESGGRVEGRGRERRWGRERERERGGRVEREREREEPSRVERERERAEVRSREREGACGGKVEGRGDGLVRERERGKG